MRRGLSRVPHKDGLAVLNRPTAERFSWTKWANSCPTSRSPKRREYERISSRAGKNIRSIDKKTLDLLQAYDWPGNIRELQNVIERSVILSSGDVLSVDELWLPKETSPPASRVATSVAFKGEAKPHGAGEIIEAALAETRGRVSGPSGAAVKLGMSPSTLEDRI